MLVHRVLHTRQNFDLVPLSGQSTGNFVENEVSTETGKHSLCQDTYSHSAHKDSHTTRQPLQAPRSHLPTQMISPPAFWTFHGDGTSEATVPTRSNPRLVF
jgi:hypothetical protein